MATPEALLEGLRGPDLRGAVQDVDDFFRSTATKTSKNTLATKLLTHLPEFVDSAGPDVASLSELASTACSVLESTGRAPPLHQSLKLRYALVRALVSHNHLPEAHTQAAALCASFQSRVGFPIPAALCTPAIGGLLTLALCCAKTGSGWEDALKFIEAAPAVLSQNGLKNASDHAKALSAYLCKGAAQIRSSGAWATFPTWLAIMLKLAADFPGQSVVLFQAASGALQTCPDELLGPCLALMQPVLCACAATDPALPLALCKDVAGHRRLTAAGAAAFYALLAALAPSLPPAPLLALLVPLLGGPAAPISLLDRVECSLAELRRACCPVKDAEACLPALNALRRAAAARQADAPALSAREGAVLARALLVLPLVVYRAAEAGASPPPPARRHAAAAACGVAVRLLSSGQCGGMEEILADLDIAVSALCGWGGLARLSEDADADPDTLGHDAPPESQELAWLSGCLAAAHVAMSSHPASEPRSRDHPTLTPSPTTLLVSAASVALTRLRVLCEDKAAAATCTARARADAARRVLELARAAPDEGSAVLRQAAAAAFACFVLWGGEVGSLGPEVAGAVAAAWPAPDLPHAVLTVLGRLGGSKAAQTEACLLLAGQREEDAVAVAASQLLLQEVWPEEEGLLNHAAAVARCAAVGAFPAPFDAEEALAGLLAQLEGSHKDGKAHALAAELRGLRCLLALRELIRAGLTPGVPEAPAERPTEGDSGPPGSSAASPSATIGPAVPALPAWAAARASLAIATESFEAPEPRDGREGATRCTRLTVRRVARLLAWLSSDGGLALFDPVDGPAYLAGDEDGSTGDDHEEESDGQAEDSDGDAGLASGDDAGLASGDDAGLASGDDAGLASGDDAGLASGTAATGAPRQAAQLRRAAALRWVAERHALRCDHVLATRCLADAQRLLSPLLYDSGAGACVGVWCQAAALAVPTLRALSQGFDALGLAEEARTALREAQRLAAALGLGAACLRLTEDLAAMLTRHGQAAAAEAAAAARAAIVARLAEGTSRAEAAGPAARRTVKPADGAAKGLGLAPRTRAGEEREALAQLERDFSRSPATAAGASLEALARGRPSGAATSLGVQALCETACTAAARALAPRPEGRVAVWGAGAVPPDGRGDAGAEAGDARVLLSSSLPRLHRRALRAAAPVLAAAGKPHLAALCVHCSLGCALAQQRALVQGRQERTAVDGESEDAASDPASGARLPLLGLDGGALARLARLTDDCLAWLLQGADAVQDESANKPLPDATTRAWRALWHLPKTSTAAPGLPRLLDRLEVEAARLLAEALHRLAGRSHAALASLQVWGSGEEGAAGTAPQTLLLCRLERGVPPLMLELPLPERSGGTARALSEDLDGDAEGGPGPKSSLVQRAVQEMERIAAASTASMRDLPTSTPTQARAWWAARLALDDALGALAHGLGADWLGPWHALLLGRPAAPAAADGAAPDVTLALRALDPAPGDEPALRRLLEVLTQAELGPEEAARAARELTPDGAGRGALAALLGGAPTAHSAPALGRPASPVRRAIRFADEEGAGEGSPAPRRAAEGAGPPAPTSTAGRATASPSLEGAMGALSLGGAATPAPPAARARSRLRAMLGSAAVTSGRAPAEAAGTAGAATTPAAPRTALAPRRAPAKTPARVAAAGARTAPARPRPGPPARVVQRAPVVLVLDPVLQALPWESVPGLEQQSMYRMPSLAVALASCQTASEPRRLDPRDAFFSLNPSGDLGDTQQALEPLFLRQPTWKGTSGRPPAAAELAEALQTRQLFVYCGHGSGEQYLPAARLRTLRCSAAGLIMGCSSGRLRPPAAAGDEAQGAVLAYLLAGCPAATANLWDVTDKDIDRFTAAVLEDWLEAPGREPGAAVDVAASVNAARGRCRLRYLNGGAAVTYGLPTLVG
ncbi:ESP1 [Auxenochlorella protothecoides x Auxenochlorella symbiontica]